MGNTIESESITHDINVHTEHINTQSTPRDYGFDNIKCILIILVVFAHLLGIGGFENTFLYKLIYSFHMPAFIFLFGYFVKFKPDGIFKSWVIPYILFQTLYILFERVVLGEDIIFQYASPNWILWYMLVCIFYQLLIPIYQSALEKRTCLTIVCVFALALVIGYDKTFAYYAALSRFFVFQPWFVLGLYSRKYASTHPDKTTFNVNALKKCLIIAGAIASAVLLYFSNVNSSILYGAYPYVSLDYSIATRALVMIMSGIYISLLLYVLKPYTSRKIPLITTIGQNTLSVYLLHGFVVKLIGKYAGVFVKNEFFAFLTAIILVMIFGNAFIGTIFKRLFVKSKNRGI